MLPLDQCYPSKISLHTHTNTYTCVRTCTHKHWLSLLRRCTGRQAAPPTHTSGATFHVPIPTLWSVLHDVISSTLSVTESCVSIVISVVFHRSKSYTTFPTRLSVMDRPSCILHFRSLLRPLIPRTVGSPMVTITNLAPSRLLFVWTSPTSYWDEICSISAYFVGSRASRPLTFIVGTGVPSLDPISVCKPSTVVSWPLSWWR